MKCLLAFALFSAGAPAVGAPEPPPPPARRAIGLDEAYALALNKSEELAQRGETVAELDARMDELWSNVKPRLNLNASQGWTDTPQTTFPVPTSRPYLIANAHQPLFSGFREFMAIRASKAQGESAELSLRRAKQRIYEDVARAYADLLGLHHELKTREAIFRTTQERLKELRHFEGLGRSRRSEVLSAESLLAQIESDIEGARGQERSFQWALRFLTGLQEDLEPSEVTMPVSASLEPFLEGSRERPDVEASRRDLEAARLLVGVQSRQRWPNIYADGNYYIKRPADFNQHVSWDVTLSAQLPLYWGGLIGAQVREASAQARSAQQALLLALRRAELEVRSAHSDLESFLSVARALSKAVSLAEANAKAQAEDYRHGLVTNLEVLSALNTVQETRLRLDSAQLRAFRARVSLEVASGGPRSPQ
jgi:outer membrane protein TolC